MLVGLGSANDSPQGLVVAGGVRQAAVAALLTGGLQCGGGQEQPGQRAEHAECSKADRAAGFIDIVSSGNLVARSGYMWLQLPVIRAPHKAERC